MHRRLTRAVGVAVAVVVDVDVADVVDPSQGQAPVACGCVTTCMHETRFIYSMRTYATITLTMNDNHRHIAIA